MAGVNEQQRLEVTNSPGSGGFTLAFKSVWAATSINRHPAAGELQVYLEGISTIGVGNVYVGKESNWVYLINYRGALEHADQPEIVADDSGLPAGCEVRITTTIEGSAADTPGFIDEEEAVGNAFNFLHRTYRRTAGLDYHELTQVLHDLAPYVSGEYAES